MNNLGKFLKLRQLTPNPLIFLSSMKGHTHVVERKHPARLTKPGKMPSLRRKHLVYNTVEAAAPAKENMTILLTSYVDDVGKPGETVEIPKKLARLLILSHKAVYPTTENIEKHAGNAEAEAYSSRYVKNTMDVLSKFTLNLSMNMENSWVVEKWHIRSAFRKAHIIVPEYAITLPEHPIKGPDMALENKEFYVTVTINKTEKVVVRCRLHHWSTKTQEKLPWVPFFFKNPTTPVFEEDKSIPESLPPVEPLNLDPEQYEDLIDQMKLKSQQKSSKSK